MRRTGIGAGLAVLLAVLVVVGWTYRLNSHERDPRQACGLANHLTDGSPGSVDPVRVARELPRNFELQSKGALLEYMAPPETLGKARADGVIFYAFVHEFDNGPKRSPGPSRAQAITAAKHLRTYWATCPR